VAGHGLFLQRFVGLVQAKEEWWIMLLFANYFVALAFMLYVLYGMTPWNLYPYNPEVVPALHILSLLCSLSLIPLCVCILLGFLGKDFTRYLDYD
jgi:hypothetical protein